MKKSLVLLLMVYSLSAVFAEKFIYRYLPGSKQKIEAWIKGDQYQNDQLMINYSQYYKTIRTVKELTGETALIEDENYFYNANKLITKEVMEVKNSATVQYKRDGAGKMEVLDSSFFPTFRNVPVFPDQDLKPGDQWTAEGTEVQDLFNDNTISVFPVNVKYTFLGYETIDQKKIALIKYEHSLDVTNSSSYDIDPRLLQVAGQSETVMYFDPAKGSRIREIYSRDYSFLISSPGGGIVASFVDQGERIWHPIELMDKDKIVNEIKKQIQDQKIDNTDVVKDDKGVKLSLENLHFYPDSTELLPEENIRLQKIADILINYKDRGVMLVGHTALAGTESGRERLSIERAKSIADYLIKKNAINIQKSSIFGKGAREPVADNETEAGRQKNRRVEIYILEE